MSKDKKLDRKILRMPDIFSQKGQRFFLEIWNNKKFVTFAAVSLAIVAVSYYGYTQYRDSQSEKAWKTFYEMSKLPEDKRWEAYTTLQNEFPKQKPALIARLQLANHYFETLRTSATKGFLDTKSADLSLSWYQKALDGGPIPLEKQLILISIGQIYEIQKKYADAARYYTQSSQISAEAKGYALLNLARNHELQKDVAKAQEVYAQVAQDYVNTEYARIAKNNLRRLKSPLLRKSS